VFGSSEKVHDRDRNHLSRLAIGDHLARTDVPTVKIRLPSQLTDAAVAAWNWNDEGVLEPEDADQRA